jgi:predicted HicB family RNase H-like nuclease
MIATLNNMAKKTTPQPPAEAERKGTETVRIDKDLARMLTVISIRQGKSVSDILSPHIRAWVQSQYEATVRQMHQELER